MDKRTRAVERFEKALKKFEEIVKNPSLFDFLSKELIVEITTKRFEYTYESMWKALQAFLREQGIECASPLNCFKEAFKQRLIEEDQEEIFAKLVKIRNALVHIYDAELAESYYKEISKPEVYNAMESLLKKLKSP